MIRSRLLVMLLALAMVPAYVIGSAGVAAAADNELVKINMPGSLPGMGADCQVPLALDSDTVGSTLIVGTGQCWGPPDISPGYCQEYEPACGTWVLDVYSSTGELCSQVPLSSSDGPDHNVGSQNAQLSGAEQFIGACDPVEVCLVNVTDSPLPGSDDISRTGCSPTDLDPTPEPPDPGCANGGNARKPSVSDYTFQQTHSAGFGHMRYLGTGRATLGAQATNYGAYVLYTVWTGASIGDNATDKNGRVVKVQTRPLGVAPGTTAQWDTFYQVNPDSSSYAAADTAAQDDVLIGAGYYAATNANLTTYGAGIKIPNLIDPAGTQTTGRIGVTDPALCAFYWGDPIAARPNTTTDTTDDPITDIDTGEGPGGGSTEPPPVPPPVEPPAPEETPEDEVGLLDWLAALLRMLIRAVQAIPAAILDGIKALFIPEMGFLDGKLDRLSTSWDDTAPAKFAASLSDIEVPQSGGCSGMPLNVNLPGGVAINENIGAACSGSMANAAGMVRLGLSAMLVLGGAMACVRAVGSGFGWNPAVGRAEG